MPVFGGGYFNVSLRVSGASEVGVFEDSFCRGGAPRRRVRS